MGPVTGSTNDSDRVEDPGASRVNVEGPGAVRRQGDRLVVYELNTAYLGSKRYVKVPTESLLQLEIDTKRVRRRLSPKLTVEVWDGCIPSRTPKFPKGDRERII